LTEINVPLLFGTEQDSDCYDVLLPVEEREWLVNNDKVHFYRYN
jgi:hypothetical protein